MLTGPSVHLVTKFGDQILVLFKSQPVQFDGSMIPVKTFIIAPIDLIKTQMQVQCIGKRMNSDYMGWRGTVRHIYHHAGVRGFTCGFMTCLGLVLFWL